MDSNELKECFDLFDHDKDGKINIGEVKESLVRMGYDKKNPNIFEVFNKLQDQDLTFDKFKEEINFLLLDPNNEESQANLYQMFFNQNKEETADLNKLKQVFEYYGQVFSDDDYECIMNFLGDGQNITFETFQKFMNKKFKK